MHAALGSEAEKAALGDNWDRDNTCNQYISFPRNWQALAVLFHGETARRPQISKNDDETEKVFFSAKLRQLEARRKQKSEQKRLLDISVTHKEQKKLELKERLALEATELAKKEALKDDRDAFTVVIGSKTEDTEADANVKDISIVSFSVYANVSLKISHGKRYGLVGPNGKGKSTLLKLLAWRMIPVPKNIDLLLVEQEVVGDEKSALNAVVKAAKKSGNMAQQEKVKERANFAAAKEASKFKAKGKAMDEEGPSGEAPRKCSDYTVEFHFPEPTELTPPLLQLIEVSFCYPNRPDFRLSDVDVGIDMGTRVAIVGPNGAGKSTLLNLLAGDLVPTEGEVRRSQKLRIGRYSQHFVDLLTMGETPVQYLLRLHPEQEGFSKQERVRAKLGKFGLPSHNHLTPIAKLSGGQKARVVFSSISMSKQIT
ncbi:unnamed protein product [Arabis nemorensis]|uniref:ABC transporter domain-containing protein n=1 Tax=Arabis nemorensis TaxID=586526 RepID=A0A565AP77_9BRAS|nr:unnamed protein product [Arabis nemorensis]